MVPVDILGVGPVDILGVGQRGRILRAENFIERNCGSVAEKRNERSERERKGSGKTL